MTEVWRSLDFMGHGNYDVSNQGRVRKHGKTSTRLMKLRQTSSGPAYVGLSVNGVTDTHAVAKLVLDAFRETRRSFKNSYVLHLDGDRTNDHIDNLRWTTRGNAIRYHRSYIQESESKDCTSRPVLETYNMRFYKSVLAAAREFAIPPIDIYNQCMHIATPQSELAYLNFEWAGSE